MNKSVTKEIETNLEVKLMRGKTIRDFYVDFFGGRLPKEFDGKEIVTVVKLDEEEVPYTLYKKFSGLGATRDFLECFTFRYITRQKVISDSKLRAEILKLVPFNEPDGIASRLQSYTLGADSFEKTGSFKIGIHTYSWRVEITEDKLREVNKDNARRLRKYLVKLSSVQGVPYSCKYSEDNRKEELCEV